MVPKNNNKLLKIFDRNKPLIGTIHCLPFPGSPRYNNEDVSKIISHAVVEAKKYEAGGMDGIIVENGWDIPFLKAEDIGYETVATMTAVANAVIKAVKIPLGIIINWNAAIASLAVAKITGAHFIRVNQWVNAYIANSGYIEGESGKVLRYRSNIGANNVKIFADVHVKHGAHAIVADRSLQEQAHDAEYFDADVLIATGSCTGNATSIDEIKEIKEGTTLPVLIGSGLSIENAQTLMGIADGAIIGSSVKKDGVWWNDVEVEQVKALVAEVNKLR